MTPTTDVAATAITWASLQPALPEIYLTAAICVLLLADVFFGDKRRGLAPTLTLLILAGGALSPRNGRMSTSACCCSARVTSPIRSPCC